MTDMGRRIHHLLSFRLLRWFLLGAARNQLGMVGHRAQRGSIDGFDLSSSWHGTIPWGGFELPPNA